MKYDIDKIKQIVREKPETAIIYFWGHTPNPKKITAACLSQWYDCYFEVDGVQYHTTEQYMMASKAKLFGDTTTKSWDGRSVISSRSLGMPESLKLS